MDRSSVVHWSRHCRSVAMTVAPLNRSAKGIVRPICRAAASILAASWAISLVNGSTGIAAKTVSRYSRRFRALSSLGAKQAVLQFDHGNGGEHDFGSPCSCSSLPSNSLTGLASRSAAFSTPKSRTNPMPADSTAHGGHRWPLAHPWRSRDRARARKHPCEAAWLTHLP